MNIENFLSTLTCLVTAEARVYESRSSEPVGYPVVLATVYGLY